MLLPYKEAYDLVKQTQQELGVEEVSITEAIGRTLAQDITADRNYPPFNRAAMDGYALKWEDAISGTRLKVIAELHAGHTTDAVVQQGECIKIMTGAATPVSADLIVRVEDTQQEGDEVEVHFPSSAKKGQNLAMAGEDVKKGQLMIKKGTHCTHDILGALAVTGHAKVVVYQAIRVAIISTGDELKPVGSAVAPHQIRNSNEYTLRGLLANIGIMPTMVRLVPDHKSEIQVAIEEGLSHDVLILSGGVSMGDADYVPQLLQQLGVQQCFHRIAIKPGKPLWFGQHPDKTTTVFGLPGNPLSCQVTFKLFVESFLLKLQGRSPQVFHLPMAQEKRKKHPLDEFFVCKLNELGEVVPKKYKGSGDITASINTIGIAHHPAEQQLLTSGTRVEVRLWRN